VELCPTKLTCSNGKFGCHTTISGMIGLPPSRYPEPEAPEAKVVCKEIQGARPEGCDNLHKPFAAS
jgi:hypothetical protein